MRHIAHWVQSEGCELVDILHAGTMDVAMNRNRVARDFLQTSATWLLWWDTDNVTRAGFVSRMLGVAYDGSGKTLVGGIYYHKFNKPWPVAYTKKDDGRYESIGNWKVGEIFPADAMGMHSVLSHRSVYEDIEANYVPLLRRDGGIVSIHKDDIVGDVPENVISPHDGKVVDGVWHQRLMRPPTPVGVQYFAMSHGRTEDMEFFEKAGRCGHQLWMDSVVESGHLREAGVGGKDYREKLAKGEMVRGGPDIIEG